jgi:hypothetical protein
MATRVRLSVVLESEGDPDEVHRAAMDALIEHGPHVAEDEGIVVLPEDRSELQPVPMDRPTLVVLMRMAADTSGKPLTIDERAFLTGLALPYSIGGHDGVFIE